MHIVYERLWVHARGAAEGGEERKPGIPLLHAVKDELRRALCWAATAARPTNKASASAWPRQSQRLPLAA